ncbi:MAG: pyridoxamine 5'-phosphate oxidase family protein, partial [Exilispira sp.]
MNKIEVFYSRKSENAFNYARFISQICGPARMNELNEDLCIKLNSIADYLIFCIEIFSDIKYNHILKDTFSLNTSSIMHMKDLLNDNFIQEDDFKSIEKIKECLLNKSEKEIFFIFIKKNNIKEDEKTDEYNGIIDIKHFINIIQSISNNINGFFLLDNSSFDNQEFFIEYLRKLRIQTLSPRKKMEQATLAPIILQFIVEHDICIIATGYKENVRATVVEYLFKNFKFYIISEAGEKYANLACNNNIALTIYDSFNHDGRTKSVQISGKARIYDSKDEKIQSILESRGLTKENIQLLNFEIFVIEIEPISIELYDPMLKNSGYSTRQIFN